MAERLSEIDSSWQAERMLLQDGIAASMTVRGYSKDFDGRTLEVCVHHSLKEASSCIDYQLCSNAW